MEKVRVKNCTVLFSILFEIFQILPLFWSCFFSALTADSKEDSSMFSPNFFPKNLTNFFTHILGCTNSIHVTYPPGCRRIRLTKLVDYGTKALPWCGCWYRFRVPTQG